MSEFLFVIGEDGSRMRIEVADYPHVRFGRGRV